MSAAKIRFVVDARYRAADAAYVADGSDPVEALAEAVIDSISTGVTVQLGDVSVFLAMLQDPDHWSEDWAERGIEDVDAFVAALCTDGDS